MDSHRREARHPLGALGEASRVGDVHRALTGFLGRKGAGIGLAHVGAAAVGTGLSQVSGICPGDYGRGTVRTHRGGAGAESGFVRLHC